MPKFTVKDKNQDQRLDSTTAEFCLESGIELTRSSIKTRDIIITVNGRPEKLSYKVKPGDVISFEIPESSSLLLTPQDIDFDIVYSDKDIIVANKPYGLTVHPSKGHPDKTLVNGLLFKLKNNTDSLNISRLSSIGGVDRPGIVHRLDKDTAGLMIIALNDTAHHILSEAFKAHKIKKTYHAIVKGIVESSGIINEPIGRSPRDRKKMAVVESGKNAITEYKVLRYLKGHSRQDHSYIEINLLTGRTHQIRVHFSHIGHPIAGDPIYSRNAKSYGISGIALCAKKLEFSHPITKEPMNFEIELPGEFQDLIKRLC